MEGVGTAANLLAVINLAAKAAEIVYKYWQKAKNCPQEVYELYQLLVGAKSTNDHLQALEAKLREQQEANGEAVFAITQLRSKAMECERVIAGLVKNLGDELEDHGKGWRKLTKSKLKWPLKEGEVLAVKKTLEEYGKLFAMALAIDTAKMVLKVVDTTERIDREAIKKLEAERKSRLLKWLSPYLYDSKHQESREKYTEGTGHWVLEDPQILSWMENQGSKLWIYGIPGAGKTILASTIITHLESTRRAKDTLVAFFYCQYNREHANDPVRIARSILAQFLSLLDDQSLFRDFLGLFDCEERTQAPPESIDIILSLITDALSLYARAYVIVDGIDECSSDVRYKLLGFLRGLSKLESIHLLLVSRNEADIRSSFGGYSTMSLDGRPGLKDDMRIAVDLELGNEQKWGHLDKQLHLLIKETLIRDSGVNMFRWLECQFDLLFRLSIESEIRQCLKSLPTTLFETYDRIVEDIQKKSVITGQLVKKALQFICGVKLPGPMYTSAYRSSCLGKQLRISSAVSLIELLQVQLTSYDVNGNLTVGSLDQSRSFRNSDALMNSCGSLVRLRTPEPYTMRRYQSSKEMKILEPAHYTVVEYLRSEYLREHSNSLVSWLSFSDKESRKVMWETFFGFILSTSANLRTGQDAARIFQRHFRLFKLFLEDEQGAHWWTSLALFCVEDAQLFELFEDIIFNHTSTLLFFLSYLHRGSERELHNDLSSRRWVYSAYEFRHVLRSFDQTISKMTAATCVPSQSIPTSHETESDAQLRINASSPTAVSKMLLFFLGMDDELLLKLLGSGPNVLWEIISPSNSATRINVGAVLLNEACRRTFVDLEVALKLIELGADYREPCFPVFQPGIGCFESFMHSGCEERSNYGGVEDMMFSVHRWVSQANPESTENTPSKLEEVIERIDSQSEDIGCVVPFSCTAVGIETALHSIARGDSYKAAEVLQHLLNIGADVNSMLPDGSTPLHFASLAARFQNYETLLGAGAEVRCNHLEQLPVFRPFGVVHRNLGGSDGIISIPSYALSCGSEGATSHPDRNNFARSTKSNRRDGGGRIIDFHRRFLIPNDSRRDISYRTVEVDDGYGQRMHMDREDDRLHYYTSKSQEEGWPCTVIPFRRVSRVEIRSRHTHMLRWGNISYGTALENASSLGIEDYEMVVESLLELGRAACACRGKRDLRSVSAHIANRTDPDSENGTSIETETRRSNARGTQENSKQFLYACKPAGNFCPPLPLSTPRDALPHHLSHAIGFDIAEYDTIYRRDSEKSQWRELGVDMKVPRTTRMDITKKKYLEKKLESGAPYVQPASVVPYTAVLDKDCKLESVRSWLKSLRKDDEIRLTLDGDCHYADCCNKSRNLLFGEFDNCLNDDCVSDAEPAYETDLEPEEFWERVLESGVEYEEEYSSDLSIESFERTVEKEALSEHDNNSEMPLAVGLQVGDHVTLGSKSAENTTTVRNTIMHDSANRTVPSHFDKLSPDSGSGSEHEEATGGESDWASDDSYSTYYERPRRTRKYRPRIRTLDELDKFRIVEIGVLLEFEIMVYGDDKSSDEEWDADSEDDGERSSASGNTDYQI